MYIRKGVLIIIALGQSFRNAYKKESIELTIVHDKNETREFISLITSDFSVLQVVRTVFPTLFTIKWLQNHLRTTPDKKEGSSGEDKKGGSVSATSQGASGRPVQLDSLCYSSAFAICWAMACQWALVTESGALAFRAFFWISCSWASSRVRASEEAEASLPTTSRAEVTKRRCR